MRNFLFRIVAVFVLIATASCVETAIVSSVAVGGIAIREKKVSDTPKDLTISTKLTTKLLNNGLKKPFNSIDVDVNEGRVLLIGIVDSDDEAQLANDLAWKVEGVKEVIDEIQLSDQKKSRFKRTISAFGDYYITSAVETKLLINSKIHSFNYQITTIDGVVYILGVARNKGELDEVLTTIANNRGVNKVVNHAILADDPRRGERAAKKGTYQEEDAEEIKVE